MRLLRIWILVVTSSLLCVGMAVGAPAEQSIPKGRDAVSASPLAIVYSQPPSPAGGLLPSSLRDPDGSATDQWAWDGFTLSAAHDITEVQWRGAYDPARLGSGGPVNDFTVDIYASIPSGTEPDLSQPPLVHYEVGGNANETLAEVLGGVQTYDYNFVLPAPFQAAAGTKYWVQIEAYQSGAPDWALAKATGGDGQYFRFDGYYHQLASGDAAFTLLAPGVAQADLSISKLDHPDPVNVGAVLTYTLTITNNGPDPATAVTVTDTLPVEVTYEGASGAGWSCGHVGGEVTCTRPSLGTGVAPDIVIWVTAPTHTGTITNTAVVSSQVVDPKPNDNNASVTTQVRILHFVYLPLALR